jgi:transposase
MKNSVGVLRSLVEQRDALNRQIAKIEASKKAARDLADKVIELAKESKVSVIDLALMIAPELELRRKGKASDNAPIGLPVRTRKTKVYKNPHTNETITTKGGNHKQLKEWKAKWGAAEVESWAA